MIPLSTDWLAITIRLGGDIERTPAHHKWVTFTGGTKVWKKRRILYNEYSEKVLTLLSCPKSSLIDPGLALVEIANEWLYHGLGVHQCLIKLKYCVYYEIVSLSRLDLCVDFVPNDRMREQIMQLADGRLEVAKKGNGSGFWSYNNEDWVPPVWKGVRCPHSTSWGHKESDVKWKLYYKSKELRDAGGGHFDKPYIVDLWRECGLDVNAVWRLEVSVKHCNKLIYKGLPLSIKAWREDTLDLFRSLYNSRFVIYEGHNRANRRSAEAVPFLPVGEGDGIRCRQYNGERVSSARISLLRRLVNSLDEEEVLLDAPTREDVLSTIDGIIRRDNLKRYFEGMVSTNYDEWVETRREMGGSDRVLIERGNEYIAAGLKPNEAFDMLTSNSE